MVVEAGKRFREWDVGARFNSVRPVDALAEGDLVFFLIDLVQTLDLSAFEKHYSDSKRGQPPYNMRMMVTLLIYSYAIGVQSSRKIALACERNLAFLAIVGAERPDFRTISLFRLNHLAEFVDLFQAVLRLAAELGMVGLGNMALDGTKIKADASRHKAMSYGYMPKEETRLRERLEQLLAESNRIDAEEDAALGSRRGDELAGEIARAEGRLAKIAEAKARLEAEAQARAEAEQRERDEAEAERQAAGRRKAGRTAKPVDPTPADKSQSNFTDPDSRIMKTNNKGFDPCYNGQAVVDGEEQIILSADVTQAANDKQQAVPMAQQTLANLEAAGVPVPTVGAASEPKIPLTADTGYFSEANVGELEQLGFDPYIAIGRDKHNQPAAIPGAAPVAAETPAASLAEPAGASMAGGAASAECPKGAAEPTAKERMGAKLKTEQGRKIYSKRKTIVEPVFGQIKRGMNFRKFSVRGLAKVRGEWNLVCLTHNLLKIWRSKKSKA